MAMLLRQGPLLRSSFLEYVLVGGTGGGNSEVATASVFSGRRAFGAGSAATCSGKVVVVGGCCCAAAQ